MKYPKRFYQILTIDFVDLATKRRVFVEFYTLSSLNGFRNISEVRIIEISKPAQARGVPKVHFDRIVGQIALSSALDPKALLKEILDQKSISMGHCQMGLGQSHGVIETKQGKVQWNFKSPPGDAPQPRHVIARSNFSFSKKMNPHFPKVFEVYQGAAPAQGSIERGEKKEDWSHTQTSLELISGSRLPSGWKRLRCHSMVNPQGESIELKIEGILVGSRSIGLFPSTTGVFSFSYEGTDLVFSKASQFRTFQESDRMVFELEHSNRLFKLQLAPKTTDFFCFTREDTDGNLVYHSIAPLIDLDLLVYDKGKLTSHFVAKESALYEQISRNKPSSVLLVN